MALKFGASVPDSQYTITSFAGADFTTDPSKTDPAYSPETKNMLQNKNGFVEKRTGTRRVLETDGNINGIFEYNCTDEGKTYHFIHIGEALYYFTFGTEKQIILGDMLLDGLKDKKSRGFSFGGAFYLLGAGYIKISYDDIAGALCYGFVGKANTLHKESEAPEIITDRTPAAGALVTPKFDGERHAFCADSAYKRIGFAFGRYDFDNETHMYIAPPKQARRLRVASVYMKRSSSGDYFRVGEREYKVISDEKGLYVVLSRQTMNADSYYVCAPYIVVEYDNFVYAPTVVTGRLPLRVKELGGDVIDGNGKVLKNYAPYTGEVLEGSNLASGLRRIDFYLDSKSIWETYPTACVRLCLNDEDTGYSGFVTGIYIDGVPVQGYDNREGEQIVYTYMAQYVDIEREVIADRTSEHVISVTYMIKNGARDVIDNCSIYGMYGGSNDTRVFLSGNKEYPARDFASGLYDASYFSDTGYTDIGSPESAIVGYHKLYSSMIVVKEGKGGECAQYLRTFSLSDDGAGGVSAIFSVKQGNISYGASAASSFKNVGGMPLYIGSDGVFAISGTNVENQNNTQSISQRVNRRLTGENLGEAVCASDKGKYYVFLGEHAYVCDIENGFIWSYFDSLPLVRCVWVCENGMYLGTEEGVVYRFMDASEKQAYYDDVAVSGSVENARAIEAVWETPMSTLGLYTNYKTIRSCYITCMPYGRSGVKVYYNTNDDCRDWVLSENIDLFSFEDVDFSRFTFRTIEAPFVFATGVKAKNVYVFGLRLVNNTPGEPFGFLAISIKYRPGKYVK